MLLYNLAAFLHFTIVVYPPRAKVHSYVGANIIPEIKSLPAVTNMATQVTPS